MTIQREWLAIRETIRANIEKHGRCIQAVGGTESDPPGMEAFMYTVGNHALGLPELLIVGPAKGFGGILLPDTRGRWPDTPGCDAPYRDQPILSARQGAEN